MEAKNGDPLVMKCQIPKTEPLKLRSVRWSKKDFHYADLLPPLEKSTYYTVGQNGDLYFSYVTSVDTGSYVCVVGNTILGRTEERTVKLKVGLSQGKGFMKKKAKNHIWSLNLPCSMKPICFDTFNFFL